MKFLTIYVYTGVLYQVVYAAILRVTSVRGGGGGVAVNGDKTLCTRLDKLHEKLKFPL